MKEEGLKAGAFHGHFGATGQEGIVSTCVGVGPQFLKNTIIVSLGQISDCSSS